MNLVFSGSEGENRGEDGLRWERHVKNNGRTMRQEWCFLANPAPMHMVASWVTSCSVQSSICWVRELATPFVQSQFWSLCFSLIWFGWDYSQKNINSQFHNTTAHHTWRFIPNNLPGIFQMVAHEYPSCIPSFGFKNKTRTRRVGGFDTKTSLGSVLTIAWPDINGLDFHRCLPGQLYFHAWSWKKHKIR